MNRPRWGAVSPTGVGTKPGFHPPIPNGFSGRLFARPRSSDCYARPMSSFKALLEYQLEEQDPTRQNPDPPRPRSHFLRTARPSPSPTSSASTSANSVVSFVFSIINSPGAEPVGRPNKNTDRAPRPALQHDYKRHPPLNRSPDTDNRAEGNTSAPSPQSSPSPTAGRLRVRQPAPSLFPASLLINRTYRRLSTRTTTAARTTFTLTPVFTASTLNSINPQLRLTVLVLSPCRRRASLDVYPLDLV